MRPYFLFELKVFLLITFYYMGLGGSEHKAWTYPEYEVRRDGIPKSSKPLVD